MQYIISHTILRLLSLFILPSFHVFFILCNMSIKHRHYNMNDPYLSLYYIWNKSITERHIVHYYVNFALENMSHLRVFYIVIVVFRVLCIS